MKESKESTSIICPICTRETPKQFQEKHHLVPRSRRGKETLLLCCSCGSMLHQIFTIKEMEKQYNNLEAILSNDKVRGWIKWIRKKTNDFHVTMAKKKRKR